MLILKQRLPTQRNLVAVYAVSMFLVYSWTLYTSFWKLPSWLFFLRAGDIISIYSYAFLVNFLESLLLLSIVLFVTFVLPRRWRRDVFTARGVALMLVIFGSAIIHLSLYKTPDTRAAFVNGQLTWWLATLLIGVLLTWVAGRVTWLRQGLESAADRFVVFLYLYLPLSIAAFLIVVWRLYGR